MRQCSEVEEGKGWAGPRVFLDGDEPATSPLMFLITTVVEILLRLMPLNEEQALLNNIKQETVTSNFS